MTVLEKTIYHLLNQKYTAIAYLFQYQIAQKSFLILNNNMNLHEKVMDKSKYN